jgi:hypothetical protein
MERWKISFNKMFEFTTCVNLPDTFDDWRQNKNLNSKIPRSIVILVDTIASMEIRAAIYMSFKKTQCSLSFIVINVIIINFEGTSK